MLPALDSADQWVILGAVVGIAGAMPWLLSRERANPGRIVARCADGSVIGETPRDVRHRPGSRSLLRWLRRSASIVEDLQTGDLTFVRVREGRSGEAAWVVEALSSGSEPMGIHWEFESVDSAVAAWRLVDERIARPPLDPAGRRQFLSDPEFDALWTGTLAEGDPAPHAGPV